jgi:hypothetical protein
MYADSTEVHSFDCCKSGDALPAFDRGGGRGAGAAAGYSAAAADGSTVKSNALPSQGNWLIIYIEPRNQFSDNLLRMLKRDQYPTLAQHAVIIVGGSIDDLKTAQTRFPELAQATWYADTNKSAFGLMKLTGAPMILGIKQRTITWSLSGILSDVNVAKSLLNTWVEG